MVTMAKLSEELRELAQLHEVYTNYWSARGEQVEATAEPLLAILRVLGAPVATLKDVPEAIRQRRQVLWSRRVEPVLVAWDGHPPGVVLRVPGQEVNHPHRFTLALENGPTYNWSMKPDELPVIDQARLGGTHYTAHRLSLIGPYPLGYHRLLIENGSAAWESVLIAAPARPALPTGVQYRKTWGVFVPLYALHSRKSWNTGDFGTLEELVGWIQGQGGGLVATLPLLAAFLDESLCEPSPYAPASRLFWNEYYINLDRVPELDRSNRGQELLASGEFQMEIQALQGLKKVDYRRQMALKRRLLEHCAETLLADPSPRRNAFKAYLQERPQLLDYAAFRATCERQRQSWLHWPERLRQGTLVEGDYDPKVQHYHSYVQWLADQQLQALAVKARAGGPGLYLDLPLGVGTSSYDVWRERVNFALGIAAGAPPDDFFVRGQNWGFPPLHPEKIREGCYSHLRAYLHHHMRLAGLLRIDHVMSLHRLFWIPDGLKPAQGLYVGYHPEEMYAVFVLEAHRHQVLLVGEDLGTVPPEVAPTMARHDMHRMYVLPFQARPDPNDALAPIFSGAVASLNTHDMVPFAGYWKGLDIDDRVDLQLLTPAEAVKEHKARKEVCQALLKYLQQRDLLKAEADLKMIVRACLAFLCRGPASVILASLEDLWLEEKPQNVPGTLHERPNWQRRASHSLEQIKAMPALLETLREMDRIVKQSR
jgi:4-alpha-glucanotransferase